MALIGKRRRNGSDSGISNSGNNEMAHQRKRSINMAGESVSGSMAAWRNMAYQRQQAA